MTRLQAIERLQQALSVHRSGMLTVPRELLVALISEDNPASESLPLAPPELQHLKPGRTPRPKK